MTDTPTYLTIQQAADLIGVSHMSVRTYIKDGYLRAIPFTEAYPGMPYGSRAPMLVTQADVEAFIDSGKQKMYVDLARKRLVKQLAKLREGS